MTNTRDSHNISSIDNNLNGKNTHVKASFGSYNIASINADVDIDKCTNTGDITGIKDSNSTSSMALTVKILV